MKTGIALSGGGARGIAHLGVIKALQEHGLQFDRYSGTSAGAIAGAFMAYGYSPDQTLDIIIRTNLYKIIRPAISFQGLLKIDKVEAILKEYFPEDRFSKLQVPFTVAATNVTTGKLKFFTEGPLIKTLLASSAIPVVFKPVVVDGEAYVDGGILNNLPVEPLQGQVDRIIGVHCNPIADSFQASNVKRLMERSLLLAINENVTMRKPKCDLLIEPLALKDYHVFDFKKGREMFQIGYDFTCELLSNKTLANKLKTIVP